MTRSRTLTIVVSTILLAAFAPASKAQRYSNAITGDPIGLTLGALNITFEHKTAAANSFTVFGSFYDYNDWSATGLGASFRWYIDIKDGKRALEGLSAGPLIAFGFWSYKGDTYYHHYPNNTSVAIGGELAYKWVFGGFVVEPILRLTFNTNHFEGLDYRPYGIGVNLGYAW